MSTDHNGKPVVMADLGIAISKNPIMGFGLAKAEKGDRVKVSWKDNKGESGAMEKTVDI